MPVKSEGKLMMIMMGGGGRKGKEIVIKEVSDPTEIVSYICYKQQVHNKKKTRCYCTPTSSILSRRIIISRQNKCKNLPTQWNGINRRKEGEKTEIRNNKKNTSSYLVVRLRHIFFAGQQANLLILSDCIPVVVCLFDSRLMRQTLLLKRWSGQDNKRKRNVVTRRMLVVLMVRYQI